MRAIEDTQSTTRLPACLGVMAAALLCSWAFAAPSAEAGFEGVGHFAGSATPVAEEKFDEEVQLGGVGGMAVNVTGAGGVPAGTLYAASWVNSELLIAMYVPAPDGGLKFSTAWQVTFFEGPYARCGPLLGEEAGKAKEPCPPRVKLESAGGGGSVDVDLDQSTGNVYVFNGEVADAGLTMITAYSPDGDEVITRFGKRAELGKTTAETPDQIHASNSPGGMAVNEAGEVYVYDRNGPDNNYERLMKFEPKVAGQYDEYEYAGTSEDVAVGAAGEAKAPEKPVLDAEGNIYVAPERSHVEKYDLAKSKDTPVCRFDYPKGWISALTVNPDTGEPFFYSSKPPRIHQLGPCNEASGKFEEVGLIEVKPERSEISALAFDPQREFSPTRAPGVLYAGAYGPVPESGKGDNTQSSLGYIFAQAEENPPEVEAQSVSGVRATSAQLNAVINPRSNETKYVFQYMTEAAYQEAGETFTGAAEAPPGGAIAGEGGAPIAVAATLGGLSPDTAYRYRTIATSHCSEGEPEKVCEGIGQPERFRTHPPAAGLPDDRAYELVSPAEKSGGQVMPAYPGLSSCGGLCKPGNGAGRFPMQSAPDGDAVAYQGTGFAPGMGAKNENEYVARRTALGWQSVSPTPQLLRRGSGNGYRAFDEELDEAVIAQQFPSLSPEAPSEYANLYTQPTSSPFALSPLLIAAPPNRPAVGGFTVRYVGASSDLSRIFFEANDALTEETPVAPSASDGGSAKFNLYEWERASGQLRLVNVKPGNSETEAGAFFGSGTLLKAGNPNSPTAVISHAISDQGSHAFWSSEAGQVYVRIEGAETRKIEASGKFLSAAADGSRVLLDDGCLYVLASEECEDLTEGKGGFKGLVGQSEDLSRIYFVDTEVLTGDEENSEGDKAQATKFNLYARGEGTTRFVATLVAPDGDTWESSPSGRTAKASPAGRYLAFLSRAQLTGYDNTGPCGIDNAVIPCPQVFLYDLASGDLSCASCNPAGTRPLGSSVLRLLENSPGSLPQPHYLTDSGRLYFDSQDSITLADTNEGVEDVYQYEPEGVGSCTRVGGCVSLISAGRESTDSNFLAADETGKNVFFTTRDRLVQRDKDELIDLYVAREGGGIAAETETTRSECQGEACQPSAVAPSDPTPSSSSFQGPGNVKAGASKPRCPKGRRQVQRKGKPRCVKRKRARAAENNRGGAK